MKLMDLTLFKDQPMQQTNVRLPVELRVKARRLAEKQSRDGKRFTESDVYRTAITLFLSQNFTDSNAQEGAKLDTNE